MAEQSDNHAMEGQTVDGGAANDLDDLQGENYDSAGDEDEAEDASESGDFDEGGYNQERERIKVKRRWGMWKSERSSSGPALQY